MQYHGGSALAGASKVSIDGSGSLLLTTDTPATPGAGLLSLHARSDLGRVVPACLGPDGLLRPLQTALGSLRMARWNAQGNNTATMTEGFGAFSSFGVSNARNVATTNAATRTRRFGLVSNSTQGNFAGLLGTTLQFTTGSGAVDGSGFYAVFRFVPSDPAAVPTARMFIGFHTATSVSNVEFNTLTGAIGVGQLSTDTTQFYLFSGGTAAQTAVALGTAVGAPGTLTADVYEARFYAPATLANTVYVQLINLRTGVATAVQTVTGAAAVPSASTLLSPRLLRTNNTAMASVALDIISFYLETEL
ncbi:hypothetical protein [Deinococcus arboris]|uniref:hypothetical protein n=1 Tax=Deinococcus arboris TaxID=2682977 RepID=UPI001E615295|nr:hypothetical protein [Deinococcus arboris]